MVNFIGNNIKPKGIGLIPSRKVIEGGYRSIIGNGSGLFTEFIPIDTLIHTRNSEAYIVYDDQTTYFSAPHEIAFRTINGIPFVQVEGASTNLISYSNAYNDAWWDPNGITITTGQLDPCGGSSAVKIIETALDESHYLRKLNIGTNADGSSTYATSQFIANAVGTRAMFIDSGNVAFAGWPRVIFNPSTKIFESTLDVDSYAYVNAGNNFSRCFFTATSDSVNNIRCYRYVDLLGYYLGDGVSGHYLWNTQVEKQQWASSPIVTNGSTVTRPAVSAYWTDVPSWVRNGKYKITWIPYFDSFSTNVYLLNFSDGSRLEFDVDKFYIADSGGDKLVTSAVTFSNNSPIYLTIDSINTKLTVSGCDTGDGEYSGSTWTFPGSGNVYLGSDSGTSKHCDGLISVPNR